MPPPWKVLAAGAAACALAVWLLVDDEDDDDEENTPQLCELCLERPEDQETDMTFGLCYQCGRMHCSTCRKKMMMAQMQNQIHCFRRAAMERGGGSWALVPFLHAQM